MEKERKEKMNNNLAMDLEPEKISYADLLKFDDDKRYELIDGVPYLMASPSVAHQRVLLEIAKQIGDYLEGKKCCSFPCFSITHFLFFFKKTYGKIKKTKLYCC